MIPRGSALGQQFTHRLQQRSVFVGTFKNWDLPQTCDILAFAWQRAVPTALVQGPSLCFLPESVQVRAGHQGWHVLGRASRCLSKRPALLCSVHVCMPTYAFPLPQYCRCPTRRQPIISWQGVTVRERGRPLPASYLFTEVFMIMSLQARYLHLL